MWFAATHTPRLFGSSVIPDARSRYNRVWVQLFVVVWGEGKILRSGRQHAPRGAVETRRRSSRCIAPLREARCSVHGGSTHLLFNHSCQTLPTRRHPPPLPHTSGGLYALYALQLDLFPIHNPPRLPRADRRPRVNVGPLAPRRRFLLPPFFPASNAVSSSSPSCTHTTHLSFVLPSLPVRAVTAVVLPPPHMSYTVVKT